jgi:hypothetical protein
LGKDSDYQRSPASASLTGIDSPGQRDVLKRMTAAMAGVKPGNVPDVASLLVSPVVRGTAWEISTP